MRTTHRVGAAVTATAAVITVGGTAAAHGVVLRQPRYGHTQIRAGVPEDAARFALTSPDVRDAGSFPAAAWANAFGCTGGNQRIRLSWHGAPTGTRSYAVTMFDPDAPTGAGFWHWVSWDIPSADTSLAAPALPVGMVAGTNDAGARGYLGPCPPAGDITHRYRITVYALDVPSLGLPADTPATVTTFTMSSHILGYARITATARR